MKGTLPLSLSVLASMLILGLSTYVQADLESIDVGDAANMPGSTEISDDGTITVVGAGNDLWNVRSVDSGRRVALVLVGGRTDDATGESVRPAGRPQRW